MNKTRSVIRLLAWIVVSLGAGLIGSAFTTRSVSTWYVRLNKPPWTPPSGIFGPVWSLLYLLMGTAAWLVWRKGGFAGARAALALFCLQLIFNAAWSAIFFGARMPGPAFAEILVLWCLILATLAAFWRSVPLAGVLMTPYLAWVTFAAALNFAVWRMNM
jgi:tryptophan-rich sensory protein